MKFKNILIVVLFLFSLPRLSLANKGPGDLIAKGVGLIPLALINQKKEGLAAYIGGMGCLCLAGHTASKMIFQAESRTVWTGAALAASSIGAGLLLKNKDFIGIKRFITQNWGDRDKAPLYEASLGLAVTGAVVLMSSEIFTFKPLLYKAMLCYGLMATPLGMGMWRPYYEQPSFPVLSDADKWNIGEFVAIKKFKKEVKQQWNSTVKSKFLLHKITWDNGKFLPVEMVDYICSFLPTPLTIADNYSQKLFYPKLFRVVYWLTNFENVIDNTSNKEKVPVVNEDSLFNHYPFKKELKIIKHHKTLEYDSTSEKGFWQQLSSLKQISLQRYQDSTPWLIRFVHHVLNKKVKSNILLHVVS